MIRHWGPFKKSLQLTVDVKAWYCGIFPICSPPLVPKSCTSTAVIHWTNHSNYGWTSCKRSADNLPANELLLSPYGRYNTSLPNRVMEILWKQSVQMFMCCSRSWPSMNITSLAISLRKLTLAVQSSWSTDGGLPGRHHKQLARYIQTLSTQQQLRWTRINASSHT